MTLLQPILFFILFLFLFWVSNGKDVSNRSTNVCWSSNGLKKITIVLLKNYGWYIHWLINSYFQRFQVPTLLKYPYINVNYGGLQLLITSLWVFFYKKIITNNSSKSYSKLLAILCDQEISKLLSIVLIPGCVIRHKVII